MNIVNENVRQTGINPLAVIDRLIADSELTETEYKDAATSYKAVASVLSKPESKIQILNPDIFPQGSMRLGTTVRPIGSDHFDLDMVCWLNASDKKCTPDQLYNWVWETLGNDAAYRDRRQKKNRCIRINYAEAKKFHLDVTPAIPDSTQANGSLFVPDRELKIWSPSHPIGFSDEWFKKAAEKMPQYELLKEAMVFANRAKIEELPEYGAFEKKPLQRIVQLLKRHRDHYFQENKKYRPTSILLTTLVTHSYLEAVKLPVKNLVEFIGNVLVGVPKYIWPCLDLVDRE